MYIILIKLKNSILWLRVLIAPLACFCYSVLILICVNKRNGSFEVSENVDSLIELKFVAFSNVFPATINPISQMSNRGGQPLVTRKIKQGPVDIDFEESALVVHYEVETVKPSIYSK